MDPRALDGAGLVVGEITVRRQDIFDVENPKENRWFFRLANKLHIRTRESAIRQQLLFHEGEPYSGRRLEESERLIRARVYLYDASIRPVSIHDGVVDIEVLTRDVWTLSAGLHYRREGGANQFDFGLSDRNFLGYGKDLEIDRHSDVDRSTTTLAYRDLNLLGSRVELSAETSKSSDGSRRLLDLSRPFYSLETRWAAGILAFTDTRKERLYRKGETFSRYYRRNWGRHLFFARLGLDFADNLDAERQLLLGGDSGLRGYPLRYQEGDRRFLLTLEERFFTDWHILQLVHVGGAVFFDLGRAWFAHPTGPQDAPILSRTIDPRKDDCSPSSPSRRRCGWHPIPEQRSRTHRTKTSTISPSTFRKRPRKPAISRCPGPTSRASPGDGIRSSSSGAPTSAPTSTSRPETRKPTAARSATAFSPWARAFDTELRGSSSTSARPWPSP